MVSFPTTWHPCVFSQEFAYSRVQLPCVQCLHRTPCYLLIKVLTSAASLKGGPECLGDVNERTLALPGRERQVLWHRWGGSPWVRPRSCSRVGMRAQPPALPPCWWLGKAGERAKMWLHFTKTLVRSLPHFTSGPREMQPCGLRGTCSAVAVQCRVPWVRFTCTSVGGRGICRGLLCLGKRHW